jgi:hypothetical protein
VDRKLIEANILHVRRQQEILPEYEELLYCETTFYTLFSPKNETVLSKRVSYLLEHN